MKLKNAFKFNVKYSSFELKWLNDINIANSVYHIFYDTTENVENKYPNERQRYTALSRMITEANKIKSIDNILYELKITLDKKLPYYLILKKYLEILIENNGNITKSINDIENFKPTENNVINDKLEMEMPQIISKFISKINQYLIENNFELS